MPLWLRPIVLLFVAALLVSCSPGSQLNRPDAATLLQRSAQYMSSVTSMHASLEVDGPVTANPAQRVLSAEGVVQQSGGIGEVTATFDYAGAPTTSTYLFREGKSWMKNPAGCIPLASVSYIDPVRLFGPSSGLSFALNAAIDGSTQASERMGGVEAWRVHAKIPTTVVSDALHGFPELEAGQRTVDATVWIAAADDRLLKLRLSGRTTASTTDTVLTLFLSNLNDPVTVDSCPP